MIKKMLSILLAVVIIIGVMSTATPVFAAELQTSKESTATTVTTAETEEEKEIVSEITSLRTESEKYFRMSDGSYIAVQYAKPVHYQSGGK